MTVTSKQLDEILLYRGDRSQIKTFSLAKANTMSLFGRGMYLTTDRHVARDYTVRQLKIGDSTYVQDGATRKEAVQNAIKAAAGIDSMEWYDAVQTVMYASDAKETYDELWARWIRNGKLKLQKMGNGIGIQKLTTGKWRVVQKNATPTYLSVYDLPPEYLESFFDADAPMPPDMVTAILDVIKHRKGPDFTIGTGRLYYPDHNPIPAAEWFEVFKTTQVSRVPGATRMGGKGVYPSYSEFAHGVEEIIDIIAQDVFDNNDTILEDFSLAFKKLGYNGLRFAGGFDNGGNVWRGGGGRPHTVYVAWNPKVVEKYRTLERPVRRPDVDVEDTEMPVRRTSLY